MRYRLHTGSVAWIIHRFSGIALTLYIFLHLYVLSSLKDPQKFESIMKALDSPLIKLSELGLLFLVAAHSFNGFRLTLLDIGTPTRLHKPLFWLAAVICALILAAGSWPFVGGLH